jgi:hypothetical protein
VAGVHGTVKEGWRSEFGSCKHVDADADAHHAYVLVETAGSRNLIGVQVCEACHRRIYDVLHGEPIEMKPRQRHPGPRP